MTAVRILRAAAFHAQPRAWELGRRRVSALGTHGPTGERPWRDACVNTRTDGEPPQALVRFARVARFFQ